MQTNNSATRLLPVIRVFVSSTFSDLKHERNALQRDVFPKLEQLCLQRGFQFQAIDLRWGVPTEAGLDHRTMRICFEELRRSREVSPQPNFLILLGNRYGWRPLPEEISTGEFEQLHTAATKLDGKADGPSVTVLRQWYLCDFNAVPPVHVLRSRLKKIDGVDYGKEDGEDGKARDTPAWLNVQHVLWSIVNQAFPETDLTTRFQPSHLTAPDSIPSIVRFQASATEQEIWHGALNVANAHEHVMAVIRTIDNVEQALSDPRCRDFVDFDDNDNIHRDSQKAQAQLQSLLRDRLEAVHDANGVTLHEVPGDNGQLTLDVTTDHLTELCNVVFSRLKTIIQNQMDEYWKPKAIRVSTVIPGDADRYARELELEGEAHQRFADERAPVNGVVGRQIETTAILDYLSNNDSRFLVVHGSSGSGKTALLAHAAREATRQHSEAISIVRFLGTTTKSSDLRSLLVNLCSELRRFFSLESKLPTDLRDLISEFYDQLERATKDRPIHVFLDALDQLEDADGARQLTWLRSSPLPPYAKLVISCLSDSQVDEQAAGPFNVLKSRGLLANEVSIQSLLFDQARTLLFEKWLPSVRRTVSETQQLAILDQIRSSTAEECRSPLYLKILFEEAKRWRSFDNIVELGTDVQSLLKGLFDRLEQSAEHGPTVAAATSYIVSARYGLTENEILEVLFDDPEYKAWLDSATANNRHELPADARRIPVALWSRLRFDLAPYLLERGVSGSTVLYFYHRQVEQYVGEQYLKTKNVRVMRHRRLAEYFAAPAIGTSRVNRSGNSPSWHDCTPHALLETGYQLEHAEMQSTLGQVLSDFLYLDCRCFHTDPYELLHDFERLVLDVDDCREYLKFVRSHAQALSKYPGTFLTLAAHEGFSNARRAALDHGCRADWPRPWLETNRLNLLTENASQAAFAAETLFELTIPGAACGCLSDSPAIAFVLEGMGAIRLLDARQGCELPGRIEVRRQRPLGLFVSRFADHLAIAYENGEAEILELEIDGKGMLIRQTCIHQFRYLVPEFESPVMRWAGHTLWYQTREGELAATAITRTEQSASAATTKIGLVTGEVSGIAADPNRILVAVRTGMDTQIQLFDQATRIAAKRENRTDVLCVTLCSSERVAIGYSNLRIIVYSLNNGLVPLRSLELTAAPTCMTWSENGLIWVDRTGHMYMLQDELQSKPVNVEFKSQSWGVPTCLTAGTDDSIRLLSSHACVCFRPIAQDSRSTGTLLAVFAHNEQSASAIELRDDGLWLVGRDGRDSCITAKASRWYVFGRDGSNRIFGAQMEGTGFLLDAGVGVPKQIESIPSNVTAVAPYHKCGFWLCDSGGSIFYLGADDRCRPVASMALSNITRSQLFAWDDIVLWTGLCSGPTRDNVDAIRAFRSSGDNGKVSEIGTRLFTPHIGAFCGATYHAPSGHLWLFWMYQGRINVRHGTLNDVLNGREVTPVTLPIEDPIERVCLANDGFAISLLDRSGRLYRINTITWEIQIVLAGNRRITDLPQDGHDFAARTAPLFFVESNTHVYSVNYHGRQS